MRFFEKIYQLCINFNHKIGSLVALLAIIVVGVSGCGSSSSGSETGYFKFYNVSSDSPSVYIEIDESDYSSVDYAENSTLYELGTDTYELELSYEEDSDEFEVFYEADLKIRKDDVDLMVLVGEEGAREVLTYEYEDENPDEDDEVFAIRFINLYDDDIGVDVYYSEDDETFAEAIQFTDGSIVYQEMTDSLEIESDETYIFYITEAGSTDVLYESTEIAYNYTTQYIMVVRQNTGPGSAPYTMDKITKTSQVIEYPDVDAEAEVRFYNAIIGHSLIPTYDANSIDLNLIDVNGDEVLVEDIARGSFSDILEGEREDLSADVYPAGGDEPFDEDSYIGVQANDDKSIFFYTTIVEDEDDNDPDTIEKTEVFIDTLTVTNSSTVSIISHNVSVINFIDDYSLLGVYFVRDDETLATADYIVSSQRATPTSISLPNNTYRVHIIYNTDTGTAKTLATKTITLDEDSKDMFLILEGNQIDTSNTDNGTEKEDTSLEEDYTILFTEQNNL